MSDNVDALKGGYDAFNSGDAEALAKVFAEDVTWEGTRDDRVPGAGKIRQSRRRHERARQGGRALRVVHVAARRVHRGR